MQKNGLEGLINLIGSNEEDFIKHFLQETLFFRLEEVQWRAQDLLKAINDDLKIPIRYTLKLKDKFEAKDAHVGSIKNRKQAKEFSEKHELLCKKTRIKILCDSNGNKYVVDCIRNYTNYLVSTNNSDFLNYTISHIWGRTDHPMFFTSLWNIAIIPNYLSHILDKPSHQHRLNSEIQNIIQAICIELYNPNALMGLTLVDDVKPEYKEVAKQYINAELIKFIEPKQIVQPRKVSNVEEILPQAKDWKVTNKDFVLNQLTRLNVSCELIDKFLDEAFCKTNFNLAYPLLKIDISTDAGYLDKTGCIRYYKQNTFLSHKESNYLICNHWFLNQRELFEQWINEEIER